MDLDTMGPGMDNDAHRGKKAPKGYSGSGVHAVHEKHEKARSGRHAAPHPKDKSYGRSVMRHDGHEGPQATSLPGQMHIISDIQKPGRGIVGVPGIISSTTLGPEVRQRLVAGIIEFPMAGVHETGPVHKIAGHDSTAYNEGMVHIAGSRFK
jgi:hypothetical protein